MESSTIERSQANTCDAPGKNEQEKIDRKRGYRIIPCHIRDLAVGDTVIHNGKMLTVDKNKLQHDRDGSTSLEGDSYRCGIVAVQRVVFAQFYKGVQKPWV